MLCPDFETRFRLALKCFVKAAVPYFPYQTEMPSYTLSHWHSMIGAELVEIAFDRSLTDVDRPLIDIKRQACTASFAFVDADLVGYFGEYKKQLERLKMSQNVWRAMSCACFGSLLSSQKMAAINRR